MSKVLDAILALKNDFEADWRAELERINIYDDVKIIYERKWKTDFCNQVLAFIVMAYDNQSGWIELHKDRWDNKEKIASKLGMNIKEKKVKDIIENNDPDVQAVVGWFVLHQIDWRWDAIISCFEYASEMFRFAKTKTDDKIVVKSEGDKKEFAEVDIDRLTKGNMAKGLNLDKAIAQRRAGEELLKELRQDFVVLDTALEKEGKRKVTDAAKNIESWESFIKELKHPNE